MNAAGSVRWLSRVLVGGAVLGSLAFVVTSNSWGPMQNWGPMCVAVTLEYAGFDPWTGMGHGRLRACGDVSDQAVPLDRLVWREPPPRTGFGTRHAVPPPVGIPLGCPVMALALRLTPRPPVPRSAVPESTLPTPRR